MNALTATTLLGAWERALAQPPPQRALTLAALAPGAGATETLARLPVGERDGQILTAREAAFGPHLNAIVSCPACAQRLEFACAISELRAAPTAPASGPFKFQHADCELEFRLPDNEDLGALSAELEPAANRARLLERCVLAARRNGESLAPAAVPPETQAALSERMSELDPQANLQLTLTCPACRHAWRAPLDIVAYLWAELHAWALRLLRDVHTLAAAYGRR